MLEALRGGIRSQRTYCRVCLLGRPPEVAFSQKRTMPIKFEVAETEEERALRRYQELVLRCNVFQNKKIAKVEEPEESPYGKMLDNKLQRDVSLLLGWTQLSWTKSLGRAAPQFLYGRRYSEAP